ncbi:unnamed protein product [Rhizophagus irregularis]|nr:unnamed protein product [Rhizophagus irregularis]
MNFKGSGSHLKELRRFQTSIWRTWKNFKGPEHRRYISDPFEGKGSQKLVLDFHIKILILKSKTKCFSTSKISEMKMVPPGQNFEEFQLSCFCLDRILKIQNTEV